MLTKRAADGCHHPGTEEELAALVAFARQTGKQLRVMGSTHSVWKAIVTDHFAGAATPENEVTVVLDRYTQVFPAKDDPAHPGGKLVEVQAGCHVGMSPTRPVQARIIERPHDSDLRQPSPWHEGSWEKSLTSTLHHRDGLALPDLGGISHQTVAGFISTGSAGGTVKWSVHEGIAALRVIDGEGRVAEVTPETDPAWFSAAGIGLGLCGVISTITFRCVPRFDVVGTETVSATRKASDLDFYGDRGGALPTLEDFRRPGVVADDVHDKHRDRANLADDRADAARERLSRERLVAIQTQLGGLAGRFDPPSVSQKRQLIAEVVGQAVGELQRDKSERREDRRELREDRRETREDRRDPVR